MGAGSTNIMDMESDSSSPLGNQCAFLESIIDAVHTIALHTEEETGGELLAGRASVEECGCGMGEIFLGHEFVCLANIV